jgi:hypothetical protein
MCLEAEGVTTLSHQECRLTGSQLFSMFVFVSFSESPVTPSQVNDLLAMKYGNGTFIDSTQYLVDSGKFLPDQPTAS